MAQPSPILTGFPAPGCNDGPDDVQSSFKERGCVSAAGVKCQGENFSSTGVNGNLSDNTAGQAGAAYSFGNLGLGIFPDARGGYSVRYKATPGVTYRVERAPNVTGLWTTIATRTATEIGIIRHHDTNAPPSRAFYRTATP